MKIHNPNLSVAECYEWAWAQRVDPSQKALLLALSDNGGWTADLKGLCDELNLIVPNFKIHMDRLKAMGLVHRRVGGGWVLDLAVQDYGQAVA